MTNLKYRMTLIRLPLLLCLASLGVACSSASIDTPVAAGGVAGTGAGGSGTAGSPAGGAAQLGGAGGASAQGGAGGSTSSGGSAAGGGPPLTSAPCEAQWEAMQKSCPADPADKDVTIEVCVSDENQYAGIGCQAEYDAWLSCTAKPGYDCNADTGCEIAQNGYFSCQSQAVLRTGCVHLGVQDADRCSDKTKPYAFSCLNMKAPAVCTQVVTAGAGIWCCPQL